MTAIFTIRRTEDYAEISFERELMAYEFEDDGSFCSFYYEEGNGSCASNRAMRFYQHSDDQKGADAFDALEAKEGHQCDTLAFQLKIVDKETGKVLYSELEETCSLECGREFPHWHYQRKYLNRKVHYKIWDGVVMSDGEGFFIGGFPVPKRHSCLKEGCRSKERYKKEKDESNSC